MYTQIQYGSLTSAQLALNICTVSVVYTDSPHLQGRVRAKVCGSLDRDRFGRLSLIKVFAQNAAHSVGLALNLCEIKRRFFESDLQSKVSDCVIEGGSKVRKATISGVLIDSSAAHMQSAVARNSLSRDGTQQKFST